MLLEPAPRAFDHVPDVRALGYPAELARDLIRIGVELGRIPLATLANVDAKIALDDAARCLDDLFHTVAATDAEVVNQLLARLVEGGCDQHVRLDQVFHVDVIADAGAVWRWVVF